MLFAELRDSETDQLIGRVLDGREARNSGTMRWTNSVENTAEARAMGLVNRVVPDAELEDYVRNYADTIAANAPLTVDAVKYIVGQVVKDESQRNLGRAAEMVKKCFESKDYVEGRTAFMEKRKPAFTGT